MGKTGFSLLLACLLLSSSLSTALPQLYSIYISTESVPSGTVGLYYEASLQALYTGPIPMPLEWKVYAGTLPPGLSLASTGFTTAAISGTPAQVGTWTFTVEAYKSFTDGGTPRYVYDRKEFTISVAPAATGEFDFAIEVSPSFQAVDVDDVIYGGATKVIALTVRVRLTGGTARDVTVSVLSVTMVRGESPISTIEEGDGIGTRIIPEEGTPPFWSKLVLSITPRILAHILQSGSTRVGVTVMGADGVKLRFATAYLDLVYLGDLWLTSVEPVQALFGETLIAGKSTVFRLTINSTFFYPVRTNIRITFPSGWSWSDYVTTPVEILPGVNEVYLPPPYDMGTVPETGWLVSPFFPIAPPECTERVVVDPVNLIDERYENNNAGAWATRVVESTNPLSLCYQPVMFEWEASTCYGSQSAVDEWSQDVGTIALQGSELVLSSFPIPYLTFEVSSIPFYYAPRVVTIWTDVRTGEVVRTEETRIRTSAEWDALESGVKDWNLAELYAQLTAAAWLAGYKRTVGIIPPLWFGTYFPHYQRAANIVGLAWPEEGRGAVLVVRRVGDEVMGPSVIAHEIAHTYGVGEKYDEETLLFSVRADEGFWISRFLPISSDDFWSFMDFYNPDAQYWIDDGTYFRLRECIRARDPMAIGIRGLITINGTVVLEPFHLFDEAPVDILPGTMGTHYVAFLDSEANVLTRVGFNVTFSALIDPIGAVSFEVVPFAIRLGWDNRTRAIEIQDAQGNVLARRRVSLNPPAVNVTFPAEGDALTVSPLVRYQITWNASDPDGDSLTHSVLYSDDNGTTWFALATDISELYLLVDMGGFTPSNASIIRVVTSDGTNVGISESRFKVIAHERSYVVQVHPEGIPGDRYAVVSVDGNPVANIVSGLSKTLTFPVGTSHVISVEQVVSGEEGVRYYAANRSFEVSSPGTCRFVYVTQYFLDVRSEYGSTVGKGWYSRDENASFSVTQEGSVGGILGLLGVKYKFRCWSGSSTSLTASATVLMDGPKEVVAVVDLDYTPLVLLFVMAILVTGTAVLLLKKREMLPPPG